MKKLALVALVFVLSAFNAWADNFQYVGAMKPSQVSAEFLQPAFTDQDRHLILFNFAFLYRFKNFYVAGYNSNETWSPCPYEPVGCNFWYKNYKTQIDRSYEQVDGIFAGIANNLGISKDQVYAAFGISFVTTAGRKTLNYDANKSLAEGLSVADTYFKKYATGSADTSLTINPWFDARPPNVLFEQWYPLFAKAYQNSINNVTQLARRYEANQVQLAKVQAVRDAQLAKEQAERQRWLQTPDGQAYLAEQARQKKAAEVKYAQEFPYVASISCKYMGNPMPVVYCFTTQGNNFVGTIELRNGDQYGLYQFTEFNKIAKGNATGSNPITIDLRPNFMLNMENAQFNAILQLTVTERLTGKVLYQKSATQWNYIKVSN